MPSLISGVSVLLRFQGDDMSLHEYSILRDAGHSGGERLRQVSLHEACRRLLLRQACQRRLAGKLTAAASLSAQP